MLRRSGWYVGRNVVYWLYREEGLALRSKQPRRRKLAVVRQDAMPCFTLSDSEIDWVQLPSNAKSAAITLAAISAIPAKRYCPSWPLLHRSAGS